MKQQQMMQKQKEEEQKEFAKQKQAELEKERERQRELELEREILKHQKEKELDDLKRLQIEQQEFMENQHQLNLVRIYAIFFPKFWILLLITFYLIFFSFPDYLNFNCLISYEKRTNLYKNDLLTTKYDRQMHI
jgi:hypothetical protein